MKTKIFYTFIVTLFIIGCSTTQKSTTNTQIFDRNIQPKPGPAPKINLGKPQTFELPNGLKVLVVENHKLPRVSAILTIDNGPIYEGEKAGVASLVGSIIGTGTKNISKDDFNKEIDFLGANLNFSSQGARLNSLSKYFPKVLGLMSDAVKNSIFSQEEFDSKQNQLIEGIKSNANSVDAIAGQVQNVLMYGKNHPKGEFVTESTAKNVNLDDVKKFYTTYYKPNNAYLIIIGDVSFVKVKELISNQFSDWKKGTIPDYTIPKSTNVSSTEIDIIDMPNAVQSNIAISNLVNLKKNDSDYFSALLANEILGGGGNARLYKNIREDKGYTYGAYSRIGNDHESDSRFTASSSVRNQVTDSAVVEFFKEIKKIKMESVSLDELQTAKATYIGNFVRALERPATAAQYALNILTEKLPENYYETYLQKLNDVTIEDVKRAANNYFSDDNARIIIVGKGTDIIPGLEKLHYPINYFDKEGNPTEKPDLGSGVAEGVTVKSVLDNYIKAIGGSEKINTVSSVMTTYEGTTPMGTIAVIEKRVTDKLAQSTLINGNAVQGMIATSTEIFMKQGPNKIPLPANFLEDTKSSMGTFSELIQLKGEKSKLTGTEKVNGKDAYKIETSGTAISTTSFYDVETGLKVKELSVVSMGGQSQTSEVILSDYKKIDGVKFANKKTISFGPQSFELTLKEALINSGITDEDFK